MILKRAYNYFTYHVCRIKDNIIYWLHKKIYGGVCVKKINGSYMFIPVMDDGIGKDLICRPIREKQATLRMIELLKSDDIVVDIGANIGYYALLCAKQVKKVYAIEPVKDTSDYLMASVLLNGYSNVEIDACLAIGDRCGDVVINKCAKSNWASINQSYGEDTTGKELVQIITIDKYVMHKDPPTIVRMDVEGYEYEILHGMTDTLPLLRYIFIELHPHLMSIDSVKYVLNTLQEADFIIYMIAKRDKEYMWELSDILNNDEFLTGKLGAFQIIFKKG